MPADGAAEELAALKKRNKALKAELADVKFNLKEAKECITELKADKAEARLLAAAGGCFGSATTRCCAALLVISG